MGTITSEIHIKFANLSGKNRLLAQHFGHLPQQFCFMAAKNQRAIDFLTSRIGGNCGDTHATSRGDVQNKAYGIEPQMVAEWISNLGEAAETARSIAPGDKRVTDSANNASTEAITHQGCTSWQ